MSEIRAAQIVLFYLFDVAETIDLQPIPGLIGGRTVAARLAPKQATPAYVQYDNPPVCGKQMSSEKSRRSTTFRGSSSNSRRWRAVSSSS